MSRDRHLPGGRRPIHTIQAIPVALTALGLALDELARGLEQNELGISWIRIRDIRAKLEQYAGSSRSMAAKVEAALATMAEENGRASRN